MTNVYLIDFDDSFTFNIYSVIKQRGLTPHVLNWQQLADHLDHVQEGKRVYILGPGPGHPKDYEQIRPSISRIFSNPDCFTLGVCLGHQLVWYFAGAKVARAQEIIHGKSVEYQLTAKQQQYFDLPSTIKVMRYNSLVVKKTVRKKIPFFTQNSLLSQVHQDDELVMARFERGVTYQFHPESIGTNCPHDYFKEIERFLI